MPLTRPYIGEEEIVAVTDVLRSGWLTTGPRLAEFEAGFAAMIGRAEAVGVSSCSAALHLLLLARGIGPGDEVITPSFTWPAAVNMIHHVGARPRFCDIDPATLQTTPEHVARAWTPAVKAVVPVHFAGRSLDVDVLLSQLSSSARERTQIIEDAAHALGTFRSGTPVGSSRYDAVFSLHAAKTITTAEGGIIVTSDPELAARLRRLRIHGVDQDAWRRSGGERQRTYDLDEPGFKYNMTDLQAALGLVQLERLNSLVGQRREIADLYLRRLRNIDEIELPPPESSQELHSWHLFTMLLRQTARIGRDDLRHELRARGIATGVHYPAVHQLAFYRERYPAAADALPATEDCAARVLSLPLFPAMTARDVERVAAALEDVFASRAL